jgi:hypothetical protein
MQSAVVMLDRTKGVSPNVPSVALRFLKARLSARDLVVEESVTVVLRCLRVVVSGAALFSLLPAVPLLAEFLSLTEFALSEFDFPKSFPDNAVFRFLPREGVSVLSPDTEPALEA